MLCTEMFYEIVRLRFLSIQRHEGRMFRNTCDKNTEQRIGFTYDFEIRTASQSTIATFDGFAIIVVNFVVRGEWPFIDTT